MLQILGYVSIISLITAALAAIIVIADKLVSNYGECEIVVNDREDEKLVVQGGHSLLESLHQNRIFVPSACGGRGTCGECKLKIEQGAGPILPTEEPYLEPAERQAGVRLCCQLKIRENLRIRIPRQLLNIQEYQAVCERVVELTHDIREFRFKLEDPPTISYTPGQYIQLIAPAYDDNQEVYRAYSISSDPAETGIVELVVRLVPGGICTTYCFNYLKPGVKVRFNGPYGEFKLSSTDAPCLFIAGGSGMAPIKCLLHQMKNEKINRSATYFFGANQPADLFYNEQMRQFTRELPDFTYIPTVATASPEWKGETGLVTEVIEARLDNASKYEAYLCGSPGMIDASIRVLADKGVLESNIFYDKFS